MILLLLIMYQSISAQSVEGEPLKVAVAVYDPPFVHTTANKQFYGFDISMIIYICKKLNRRCEYVPMPFKNIIDTVAAGDVDIAVSSITITPERGKKVRFSIPYLESYSQFLVHRDFNEPYTLSTMQKNTIGYLEGSLFPQLLAGMGINENIESFKNDHAMIADLHNRKIGIVITDEPTANYWLTKSKGKFKLFGKPFKYGVGYAIAIRPDRSELANQINVFLNEYIKSKNYQDNIKHYISNNLSMD